VALHRVRAARQEDGGVDRKGGRPDAALRGEEGDDLAGTAPGRAFGPCLAGADQERLDASYVAYDALYALFKANKGLSLVARSETEGFLNEENV